MIDEEYKCQGIDNSGGKEQNNIVGKGHDNTKVDYI
jgi:hypothetical protein